MASLWNFVPLELTVTSVLSCLAVFLVFYIAYRYLSAPRGLPPGPRGLPIVGYFPFLGKSPHEKFRQLGKKYGNVFSFYIGKQLIVVLNDLDAIKEALVYQGEIFSGRPDRMNINLKSKDNLSIETTDGSFWREHRKFAIDTMKDLGLGKKPVEALIQREVELVLKELEKSEKQPTNIRHLLGVSICNTVSALTLGRRFGYDDAWLLNLNQVMSSFIKLGNIFTARIFFPWLKCIPGTDAFTQQKQATNVFTTLETAMEEIVEEKKTTHIHGQRGDYLNSYLTEKATRSRTEDATAEWFSDKALIHNLRSFFVTGTEFTANTLMWCIIYMMQNPELQQKIQKEIDKAVEPGRLPMWSDRIITPLTEATLLEIQRIVSLSPLSYPRRNIDTVQLLGHKIPKNSYVISNLWNVHHDPDLWKNPEEFQPERFLTENGEVYKPEHFMPFSIGKRQCLGESLAQMELYLYFTALLQNFTFEAVKDDPVPPLDKVLGVHFVPKAITTCAIPRK